MSKINSLYNNPILTCTVVSDTHIDINHPVPALPMKLLRNAIDDSTSAVNGTDAFIIIGDTTSRGNDRNWELVNEVFKKIKRKPECLLMAIGNHDTWSDEGTEAAIGRYLKNYTLLDGKEHSKTYFSKVIKGCYFIFLGSEGDADCEAEISDDQLEWFSSKMKDAGESGKPIFVFCHQSLNGKHGLPKTFSRDESDTGPMDGGIGTKSAEIEQILKKYSNVYYFSGHSHMGISSFESIETKGYSDFEKDGNLTLINLPSLACGNHHGEFNKTGCGLQLEVYDDKVVLRPRRYNRKKWLKSVKIKDGKPYYEETIK